MGDQPNIFNPVFSVEQRLAAYDEVVAKFGFAPVIRPGRIKLLGWDLEYVCGAALATFIDQLLIRRLNDFMPDNDYPLILDCGANIGFTVLNYKRQFPNARIIAFEPDPQFAPVLKRNLINNGAGDVDVVESAVWINNGEMKWFCEGIDGSKIIEAADDGLHTIVKTIDLADYLMQDVDLLKIDIEGAEYDVISHVAGRLRAVKNILVECHISQDNIVSFAGMLQILKETGFNIGINSFGAWRDLIRQTEILPNHWGQYLSVAGWRDEIPNAEKNFTFVPYIGRELPYIETRLQRTQADLQQTKTELRHRMNQFINHLFVSDYEKKLVFDKYQIVVDSGHCWKVNIPAYLLLADDEFVQTSLLRLFEDGKELGPAHAIHDDIRRQGGGLYSHWKENLYFSSSDNTDPNSNGRKYWILIADE